MRPLSPAQRAYLAAFDRLLTPGPQDARRVKQDMADRLAEMRAEQAAR